MLVETFQSIACVWSVCSASRTMGLCTARVTDCCDALVQNCHECEAYLVKNGLLEVLEADKKKGLGQMVQQMRIALKSVDLNA